MKDPQRLLESGGSSAELTLLQAADAEEPSEQGRQRLAAALGIALTVSTASTAAAATQAGASAVAKTATGAKLASHWLVALVVGAVLGGAAVAYIVSRPSEKTPLVVSNTVSQNAKAAVPTAPPALNTPESTGVDPELLAQEAPAVGARVARPDASGDAKSIAGEMVILEGARTALGAGDARKALSLLGEYSRKYPRGML
ncbi:MAG TPA: hypothetical protein VGP93_09580, partial [Polyangiaceae bacterium]|nr:hypothetical protein [Polyangiaceae bacterium]